MDFHTVELAPAVEEALKKVNLIPAGIGALAVALGPGSFTGLRIGLALVKGMALVHHVPILGIPTLDILAIAQPVADLPLVAVLRAGRGRLAVGWYKPESQSWRMERDIEVCTPQQLIGKISQPSLLCGELSSEERELFHQARPDLVLASPAQSLRRPGFLAELAWKRWKAGKIDDPASLSPVYLHYNDPIPE